MFVTASTRGAQVPATGSRLADDILKLAGSAQRNVLDDLEVDRNWSEVVAYLLDQQQAIPLVQGLRGQLPHHAPVGTLDDLVPPKLPTIGDTGLIYQVREELGVNTLSIDALNHIPCAAKDP